MKLNSQKMNSVFLKLFLGFFLIGAVSCNAKTQPKADVKEPIQVEKVKEIALGIGRVSEYLPLLQGKKVGVVSNHTSIINGVHLVDTLLKLKIDVIKVYSPEHGFRGKADAGKTVKSETDDKTGLPIISLYGSNKKASKQQLSGVDVLVFDMQDVGARFYTYISTLHYVMEAAAENDIPVIVLDRPNPNGHFVDGPILEKEYKSFVGMHPIPVVHGMTIGEYAKMINGEGWLKNKVSCELTVIPCSNYDHNMEYNVEVSPSPNLPNMASIYNYSSICFLEGTIVSVGRGTSLPFQQIGHPDLKGYDHSFTPKPSFGASDPKLNGELCYGKNLTEKRKRNRIELEDFIQVYDQLSNNEKFFTDYFNLLAGNSKLQEQLKAKLSEDEIRESWQEGLTKFKNTRKKYLLYPDFE